MSEHSLQPTWENRAERRRLAAARAREIAATFEPGPCNCSEYRRARIQLEELANKLDDPNGMTGVDLWIAWRERKRASR